MYNLFHGGLKGADVTTSKSMISFESPLKLDLRFFIRLTVECFIKHIFFVTFGERLCFQKCYWNRSSKYKVCVGVCLYLCWCVSGCRCVFVCRYLPDCKPLLYKTWSICSCYLRSNSALWPHHRQVHKPDLTTACSLSLSVSSPSKRSYGDSRIDKDFL